MKRRRRAIVVVIFTFVCLALAMALTSRKYVAYNTGRAVAQSKQLATMCAVYREHKANPERGKYPTTLALLADPPFTDKKQFLDRGEQDLIDPWGNPYCCAIVKNPNGEEEVY